MQKIAFITCEAFPELYYDEQFLIEIFQSAGFRIVSLIWTKPNDLREYKALIVRSAWDYHLKTKAWEEFLDSLEAFPGKLF